MTTRCGIRGIKSIEKTQSIENKVCCCKDGNETADKSDIKKVKPKEI
ncbi:MAG: hypothetical protein ABFC34_10265 [Methanobacterium sp.]